MFTVIAMEILLIDEIKCSLILEASGQDVVKSPTAYFGADLGRACHSQFQTAQLNILTQATLAFAG